jgi:hypothetical protein
MQWTLVTVGDLNDSRAAPIVEAARTSVLASGQSDPVPNLIAKVVEELRGVIGFSGKYQLDGTSDSTLPPNLKDLAVLRVGRMAKSRIAMPWDETDKEDERTYQSRLGSIRDGKWPIDRPDTPAAVLPGLPLGTVGSNPGVTRQFTASTMRNL